MSIQLLHAACVTENSQPPKHLQRELRRADQFIRLAVVATQQVLEAVGSDAFPQECGLFVGTSFGPMETNFEVLDQVISQQQTSPTLFSHSVFNGAAGYLTRIFKIHGCSMTLTDFSLPFFQALQQAYLALSSGVLSEALVVQVETYSRLLLDARNEIVGSAQHFTPGCACWYLSCKPSSRALASLDSIAVELIPANARDTLHGKETIRTAADEKKLLSPLDTIFTLSGYLLAEQHSPQRFVIEAPHGHCQLLTSPST